MFNRKNHMLRYVLGEARKADEDVSIFIKNGYKLRGRVVNYDNSVVLIRDDDNHPHMVCIDAISTISDLPNHIGIYARA